MAIEKRIWDEFTQFQKVCRNNPVFPECPFLRHLEELLPRLIQIIRPGESFFRARVYKNSLPELLLNYAKRMVEDIEHWDQIREEVVDIINQDRAQKEAGFNGFDAKGSFVNPNPETVHYGRCNHDYEVCLYMAEDTETAISEIKPLIREEISVACIKVKEELRIVDLKFNLSDNPYKELTSFLFVTSPTQEDYDAYLFSQIICSLVKKNGYDGIKYTSCQNLNKINYVIFNYDKCEAVSSDVYTVDSIKYEFTKK